MSSPKIITSSSIFNQTQNKIKLYRLDLIGRGGDGADASQPFPAFGIAGGGGGSSMQMSFITDSSNNSSNGVGVDIQDAIEVSFEDNGDTVIKINNYSIISRAGNSAQTSNHNGGQALILNPSDISLSKYFPKYKLFSMSYSGGNPGFFSVEPNGVSTPSSGQGLFGNGYASTKYINNNVGLVDEIGGGGGAGIYEKFGSTVFMSNGNGGIPGDVNLDGSAGTTYGCGGGGGAHGNNKFGKGGKGRPGIVVIYYDIL